ncbi:APC family permease [Geofilum rubicundum]|uniref:Amino acid permease n=1 Tax=Geofilum rubicundum JCM 15548 TaxID=1236989 RepID=A0A0E9LZG5_9BACT|nr:amino acid permease [Geofilum rubicundum]GAO30265.1 amino acid permease [Geofilum rubicundum JCM 15548]
MGVLGTVHPLFQNPIYELLFFVLLFGGLALVNIIGVQQGIGLVKILTVVKLLPLVLLVSVGWKEVEWTYFIWTDTPDAHSLGQMALVLFFAFQGAESGLAVSGEVSNPRKNVPKGIFMGLSAVLVLYVFIQYVSLGVLGTSLMDYKEAPLAEVAHRVFGRWGLFIMTAVAAFSMFGNLSGEVLSMPRVLFGAAHDRVIPVRLLARVHPRFSTPYVAIMVYALLGLGLAVFGGFRQLAVISGASILLVYLGVALTVLRLRKSHPSTVKAFRILGGALIPLASVAIIFWFLTNLEKQETLGLMGFILLLSFLYLWIRRFRK